MDLGFTEEQLATLMEGYKAMNGDASASDIVSDLGIQNYVTVSNGEMVSKPAEPVVQTTSTGTTDFGIPDINYVPENPSTNVNVDLSKVGGDSTTNPTTPPSNPVVDNSTPSTGGKTTETPKQIVLHQVQVEKLLRHQKQIVLHQVLVEKLLKHQKQIIITLVQVETKQKQLKQIILNQVILKQLKIKMLLQVLEIIKLQHHHQVEIIILHILEVIIRHQAQVQIV